MTQHPLQSRNPRVRNALYLSRVKPLGFYVASGLALLGLSIELGMLCSVFYLRSLVVTVGTKPPIALHVQGTPSPSPAPAPTAPTDIAKTTAPTTHPAAITGTPADTKPTGPAVADNKIPKNLPMESTLVMNYKIANKIDQINDLLDQAAKAAVHHQTTEAEALLHRAESIDPRSLIVLEAMAKYYADTSDPALSCIYWQRLVDQGPEIGSIYSEAKDQLQLKGTVYSNPLRDPSPWPRGIYIQQVVKTTVKVEDEDPVFHLRVDLGLKDIPNFDQKKLRPFVIFYQALQDGSHKVDPDQTSGTFEHAFLFQGTDHESFDVTYKMPDPGGTGHDGLPSGEYYGFIVALYYDGTLQDSRSEPSSLWIDNPLPQAIEQ